jgi:hypothetical protein
MDDLADLEFFQIILEGGLRKPVNINVVAGLLWTLNKHWHHNELPLHAQPRRKVVDT